VCFWRLGELSMSLPARVRAAAVPAVGMVCDPWMLDGPRRDPYTRTRRPRFDGMARWLFVSRALREQVAAGGVRLTDTEIVPAGVELGAFAVAPARAWRGRLLYAGRLSPLKGVDVAIRALAAVPGTTLDVAGAGDRDHEDRLVRLARALHVTDRVRFRGVLSRPALAGAYADADAVLFPVRWREPFGLVPLEAMATGTPVIGTASGGAAETLVDGRSAVVVPPDDPDAIATAVRRLARDAALRARLRAGGRRMAERYPAERSHAAVAAALEAACAKRQAKPSVRKR
jgi:glycogen synthase